MQTAKTEQVEKTAIADFIKSAVESIKETNENIDRKRINVSFDSDYCNAIVDKLHEYPQLAKMEKAVIKLALNQLFKKVVMSAVAKELNIVELKE